MGPFTQEIRDIPQNVRICRSIAVISRVHPEICPAIASVLLYAQRESVILRIIPFGPSYYLGVGLVRIHLRPCADGKFGIITVDLGIHIVIAAVEGHGDGLGGNIGLEYQFIGGIYLIVAVEIRRICQSGNIFRENYICRRSAGHEIRLLLLRKVAAFRYRAFERYIRRV